ncbi:MAG: Na+/H+ antiporter NhaA, partial [Desulfuromonadales bacterium]|nr:Na+/H+ antiporter NhaA [Desulfuromonadales bacterium]
DDIGAIIIIALFYSGELSASSLYVSFACMLVLWMLNRRGVVDTAPYIIVGIVFWVAVLKSGVHATLAGLILAFFIPLTSDSEYSPLKHLEEDLHPVVAFAILPIFAFANVGIPLDGLTFASLLEPVPLGIALGLFLGNQIGVFGLSFLAIRLGFCRLPENVSWLSLYGVACLCGIGFTMSLFISSLAFEVVGTEQALNDRLGILLGSLI